MVLTKPIGHPMERPIHAYSGGCVRKGYHSHGFGKWVHPVYAHGAFFKAWPLDWRASVYRFCIPTLVLGRDAD